MTSARRRDVRFRGVRTAALLLSCAFVAVSCSEDPGDAEPQSDRESAYCEAYRDFFSERANAGQGTSDAQVVATMKSFAATLGEVEAPESMGEEEHRGLETWTDLISQAGDDATQSDMIALEMALSEQESADIQSFFEFNDATCLTSGERMP